MTYTEEFKKALKRVHPDKPDLQKLARQNNLGQLGYALMVAAEQARNNVRPEQIIKILNSPDADKIGPMAQHAIDSTNLYRTWVTDFCPPDLCPRCNGC